VISCSSTSRASTRRAVCCCLRGAVRSARSITSTSGATRSSFGAARCGTFRGAGSADASAARTVRRCTLCLSASWRIDSSSSRRSRRIASNSSTLDLTSGPPASSWNNHDPTVHRLQVGPGQAATAACRLPRWSQIRPPHRGQLRVPFSEAVITEAKCHAGSIFSTRCVHFGVEASGP